MKGKIQKVSAEKGGICIDDIWYNCLKKPELLSLIVPEIRGRLVEINIPFDGKTIFDNITVLESNDVKQEKSININREDYWSRKEQRDMINDRKITRHGALNTAIEIVKNSGFISDSDTIFNEVQRIANKVIDYVTEEKQ
ncbi:MAG: hypothetical protein Q8P20_07995 [bacterium]|nr:hypothetical protein [bacterium]MDZ4227882.1 hypothetical protein [Candidatus Levybacteria bacterium]